VEIITITTMAPCKPSHITNPQVPSCHLSSGAAFYLAVLEFALLSEDVLFFKEENILEEAIIHITKKL
jgi:hypothetical protein